MMKETGEKTYQFFDDKQAMHLYLMYKDSHKMYIIPPIHVKSKK